MSIKMTANEQLKMKELVEAIMKKTYNAKGVEHELYEDLAFYSSGSFDYGIRVTMYALYQTLGKDVENTAIESWLKS